MRIPAELAEGRLGRKRVVLAKPIRFMNESGEAVRALVDYFKSDRLLVVHDDIDLALGRLRLQVGGGSGGHNGVKAIIAVLGAGFPRLKVGVGRPPGSQDPADFVLERFSKSERSEVDLLVPDGAEVVERWLTDPDLERRVYRDPALLKICLLRQGAHPGASSWISAELERNTKALEEAERWLQENGGRLPKYSRFVAEYGREVQRMRVRWLEQVLGETQRDARAERG